ncbi:MAG: 30S ribosomal protein S8 [Chlamydiia bacterium]|nr:30S ribosomal protein S8 [Chlamydiia bacterium]
MNSDPIADLLTRIRNAQMARQKFTTVPKSKMNEAIIDLMIKQGYLLKVEKSTKPYMIKVYLKYNKNQPMITQLRRVSKPGRRVYVNRDRVPYVRNGFGTAIMSTSKGICSDVQARKSNVGGEVLCTVY